MTAPLHLTIRFSASIPDLDIDIPSPDATTVLSLKHTLRARLLSRSRLKLIYQGRLLPDTAALTTVFKAPLAAAAAAAATASSTQTEDGSSVQDVKGKGVDRGFTAAAAAAAAAKPVRIYVQCSIGDELSQEDLTREALDALTPPPAITPQDASAAIAGAQPQPSTRPRPRGFDRLLVSGFTQVEISTLRTQFASINADRFPPDAPPSPDRLRALEDRWIDSNAGADGGATTDMQMGAGWTGEGAGEDTPSGLEQGLDVFIRAMMIGFFFPLGSLSWLLRQEGIWGDRWQIFVGAGAVLSVVTGAIMCLSGGR